MFENLRADIRQHSRFGRWYASLGFWVTATYRLGSWANRQPSPAVRVGGLVAHGVLSSPWRFFKGVHIPARTKIGPGLCIHHAQNIIIDPDCEIGTECEVFQEVTLGRGAIYGVPSLGNRVKVFAGGKVLGGVHLGDDVEVGANAVVAKDVDAGALVVVQSRAIPRQMVAVTQSPEARQAATAAGEQKRRAGGESK